MNFKKNIPQTDIRDAFFEELYRIAARNRNIIFLTADMGALSLEKFKKQLSAQYINVGVAEQNLVNIAAGLALGGKKVFVYAIAPFMTQRCYEQIRIDLCCMRLPVTIIGVGVGIAYNSDGPTHHAIEDIAIMHALPGMTIYTPSDSIMAAGLVKIALDNPGPLYVRMDKGTYPLLYKNKEEFLDGLALLKKGRDLTIVTTGTMVHQALKIADSLARYSIDAGVLDLYRIKPVNEDLLLGVLGHSKRIVTLEEHSLIGGIGSLVAEILADNGKSLPMKRIGFADRYCSKYGDREWMRSFYGLDADSIVKKILNWSQLKSCSKKYKIIEHFKGLFSKDGKYFMLKLEDFASLFGTTVDDIPEECKQMIAEIDFRYKILNGKEQEAVLLSVLKKIDSGNLTIAGREKKAVWEKGWSENLINFTDKGCDLNELIPKYYRPGQPIRLNREYVKSFDPNFEYNFFKVFRLWLYKKFLKEAEYVYEFGCGPGHNLVALAKLYPGKKIYGLDWADSAVKLVNKIAQIYKFNITSRAFDMLNPDEGLKLEKNSLVITMGALEQLGEEFEPFLNFIIRKSPMLCIHVEPFCELYDENNLIDYVAIQHHKRRNLLGKYLEKLRMHEAQGKIKILRIQRMPVGGLLEDGWSYVIWKPLGVPC